MAVLGLVGGLLAFFAGFLTDNDMTSRAAVPVLFLGLCGFFMIAYGLDSSKRDGMREASRKCQLQECPYEYRVETSKDTLMKKK